MTPVLLVTTGNLLEVYAPPEVRVHHARGFVGLKGAQVELLAEQLLEREVPWSHKPLFCPGCRRLTVWLEPRTIVGELIRVHESHLLKALRSFGQAVRRVHSTPVGKGGFHE